MNCGSLHWTEAMPVITSLEAHQRDGERVKLFLDDEYALDLPVMQAARLSRGQTLTQADIDELAGAASFQGAFDQAVRFLSYRPRSIEEIRRHLVKKQASNALVIAVLERLRQRGYVDDMAFARFWLDNRDRFKPMGARALRYELRQKGVDDEIVEAALSAFDEDDAAFRAAQSRLSRYRGSPRRVFRHKLSALLRRRGFGEYAISDALSRLQDQLEHDDPGYFQPDDAD